MAAWRADGMTAPMVVDGAMNGDVFLAYVNQQRAPTLRPGDVVMMDNLSSHKRPAVKTALAAAGATLRLLPPYSPDLNPIEKALSKLKAKLRAAAKRTVAELENYLEEVSATFAAGRCRSTTRVAAIRTLHLNENRSSWPFGNRPPHVTGTRRALKSGPHRPLLAPPAVQNLTGAVGKPPSLIPTKRDPEELPLSLTGTAGAGAAPGAVEGGASGRISLHRSTHWAFFKARRVPCRMP